jgi:hypothetical protein
MQRGWSVWDEVNVDYPAPSGGQYRSDPRVQACQQRVEFLLRDGGRTQDIARRQQAWADALASRLANRRPPRAVGESVSLFEVALGSGPPSIIAGVIALVAAGLLGGLAAAVLAALAAAVFIALMSFGWKREQRMRRLQRVLLTRSCGRCHYGFGDTPPERIPACPECGEPWPLIPPPADLATGSGF